jgi:hypothetical protein
MIDSKNVQNAYIERKNQTLEVKWSRAEKVREEKQRRKDRLKRYEVHMCTCSNSRWIKPRRIISRRCSR